MVIYITIAGQPIVKKSNQKVGYNPRIGRTIKYNTRGYNLWHEDALDQLGEQGYNKHFRMQKKFDPTLTALIDYPVNLQCKFFMATNGRTDLSALYEGIQDVLVEVGILKDDNWHIVASHDGSGVEKDADDPRMEITITPKNKS